MPQQSTFGEAEKKAAERYKWWVVYLMREKRRLAGIAQAVQAGAAAQAEPGLPTPEVLPGESAEDFLMRVEQEREAAFLDPLSLLEDVEGEDQKTAGNAPLVEIEEPEAADDLAADGVAAASVGDLDDGSLSTKLQTEILDESAASENAAAPIEYPGEDMPARDSSNTNANRLRGKTAVRLSRAAKNGDDIDAETF